MFIKKMMMSCTESKNYLSERKAGRGITLHRTGDELRNEQELLVRLQSRQEHYSASSCITSKN
jgi:hypothetical protein